jgi:hypothetical protein
MRIIVLALLTSSLACLAGCAEEEDPPNDPPEAARIVYCDSEATCYRAPPPRDAGHDG